jgi:hypothetical protein
MIASLASLGGSSYDHADAVGSIRRFWLVTRVEPNRTRTPSEGARVAASARIEAPVSA